LDKANEGSVRIDQGSDQETAIFLLRGLSPGVTPTLLWHSSV